MRRVVKFCLKVGKLGPTLAGTLGVTRLRHEAIDHAVKDNAVIKTLPRQCLDALDMRRGDSGKHLNGYAAAGGQI